MCSIKVLLLICAIIIIECDGSRNVIELYYSGDDVQEIDSIWAHYKTAMGDAIGKALHASIGFAGMNVLVKSPLDKKKLAVGYWHNDNQVQLVLQQLLLDDVPRFDQPKVSIELGSNVIQLKSRLSKMIITADYMLLRKKSRIVYDVVNQNASVMSPFLFQQVATKGQVTITVDRCLLDGHVVAVLSGTSLNPGYHYFRLSECQYKLEIYQPGSGTPPVCASYYPINGGLTLEHLLLKPIYDEFMPKLQSALFSTINTTSTFEGLLSRFRSHQKNIFRNVSVYMTTLVRNLNDVIRKKSGGFINIKDIPKLTWSESHFHTDYEEDSFSPLFNSLVLSGLDTAYTPNTGGPFQLDATRMIGDQIRFSTLQVRGNEEYGSNTFAVEIRDVAIDIEITAGDPLQIQTLDVVSFGSIAFIPNFGGENDVKAWFEPVVLGFIQNKFPEVMMRELKPALDEALRNTVLGTVPGKYGSLGSDVVMVTVPYPIYQDQNGLLKQTSNVTSWLPKNNRNEGPKRIEHFGQIERFSRSPITFSKKEIEVNHPRNLTISIVEAGHSILTPTDIVHALPARPVEYQKV